MALGLFLAIGDLAKLGRALDRLVRAGSGITGMIVRVRAAEGVRLGLHSNWRLEIVPDTGHDYRRMGEAAARYLYVTH